MDDAPEATLAVDEVPEPAVEDPEPVDDVDEEDEDESVEVEPEPEPDDEPEPERAVSADRESVR